MSFGRITAVGLVFILAAGGWWTLGVVTERRSTRMDSRLGRAVEELWGVSLVQEGPAFTSEIPGTKQVRQILPAANAIDVNLSLEHRRKGLIWYATYVCDFRGEYTVTNSDPVARKVQFAYRFPSSRATYDRFTVLVDGRKLDIPINAHDGIRETLEIEPGGTRKVAIAYRTFGLDEWRYRVDRSAGRILGLRMRVKTDFADYDFPEGTLSPMEKKAEKGGAELTWEAEDLLTQKDIGVKMPQKLNPGPLATRMSFFAPVCLVFFFVLVTAICIVRKVKIHPVHYLFVAAGFFGFHLLFAYLLDHVNVHAAFAVSAAISVTLVTLYLKAALKGRLPWTATFGGQAFYLVLFSYTFFMKGMTGLTIAVGSIATLAVMMKLTAGTDWDEVFGGGGGEGASGREG
ncbi:MAG: inner membrane CreD family protein [Planctomycetes bacterium]|nr:inner membrane CreD family protein [Planctomycetota bacterium]